MGTRRLVLALIGAVGLGALLLAPARAAEKLDAEKLAKLVEQLGSDEFSDRETAMKELATIGAPALEALRKGAQSDNAEIKRRCEELATKIEKTAEVATILNPKKVRLSCKDVPVAEAVAQLKKQSGYDVAIHDPDNKLKDRTVTLDTGEVTFWHALGQLCDKAGLIEATPQDLMPRPVPVPRIGPLPGVPAPGFFPAPPPVAPPGKGFGAGAAPAGATAPAVPAPAPAKTIDPKDGAAAPAAPPALPAVRAAMRAAGVAVAAPAVAVAGPVGGPMIAIGFGGGGWAGNQPGRITVMDGKETPRPTDDSGAVRVRVAKPMPGIAGMPVPDGQLLIWLEVSPEPRLRWQGMQALRIKKALDDQDQKLSEVAQDDPAGAGGFGIALPGGVARPMIKVWRGGPFMFGMNTVQVRLKKGDKESKSLKELSGSITANLLADAKAYVAVENVLKAADKTVKGQAGASIKVLEVKEDKEQTTIRFELTTPPFNEVQAENNPFNGGTPTFRTMPLPGAPVPPIKGVPVPLPAPLPPGAVPPAAPAPAGAGGAAPAGVGVAAPGRVVDVPVVAPAPAGPVPPLPPGVIGAPAVFQMPLYTGPFMGLTLEDDKGKVLPVLVQQQMWKGPTGPNEYTLVVYHDKEKVTPARLVFTGRKVVTVDVPFTLKNVSLEAPRADKPATLP